MAEVCCAVASCGSRTTGRGTHTTAFLSRLKSRQAYFCLKEYSTIKKKKKKVVLEYHMK